MQLVSHLALLRVLFHAPPPARLGASPVLHDFAAVDWNEFHQAHSSKEWLLPSEDMHGRLSKALRGLPRSTPLLELGCGTSTLAAQLVDAGWCNVTAIDISRHAVEAARVRDGLRPALRYLVADARNMKFMAPAQLGAIIDKGTLDAVCCGDGFDWEAKQIANEMVRVLVPGGRWICLSLMPPSVLLPLIQGPKLSCVGYEAISGLHLYAMRRCRAGTPVTRWHWHPIEGGWRTRVTLPL